MTHIRHLLLIVLCVAPLTGCAFHRVVINEDFSRLDTSFIETGRTDYMTVLKRMGPPGPISVDRDSVESISERHLRYSTVDTRDADLKIAYYLILPFKWSSTAVTADTLIEFDENGVVTNVTKVRRDNVWRPLQDASGLAPKEVTLQ